MKRKRRNPRARKEAAVKQSAVEKRAPLAKLSRPRLPPLFERVRLVSDLDNALDRASIVWIEGSPGAGKTTLAASWLLKSKLSSLWYQVDAGDADPASFFYYLGIAIYDAAPRYRHPMRTLTPEYLAGLDTFARNFFRELARRMKRPFVIVLDNLQEAGTDGPLYEVLRHGLEELPADCHAVLVSRAKPPQCFARAQLDHRLAVLGGDGLRLSEEESVGLVKFLTRDRSGSAVLERASALHKQCDGWFAGMLLLTESPAPMRRLRTSSDVPPVQRLFDYFAGEVFARRPPAVREFLMSTSLFPSFTRIMSEQLTGNVDAQRLLKELVREYHFTEEHSNEHSQRTLGYRYHPLFRQFLLERASAEWDAQELAERRRRAAHILEQAHQPGEALALYLDASDTNETVRLLLVQAPQLIASGRLATLSSTIEQLPSQVLRDHPWLLYWQGMSRMPFDPAQSRSCLMDAFARLRQRKDIPGMLLAWSGLLDGMIHALSDFTQADSLIDVIDELGGRRIPLMTPDLVDHVAPRIFAALACRQPGHSDFEFWRRKALAVLERATDIELRLVTGFYLFTYHTWVGERAQMEAIIVQLSAIAEAERTSTLAQLTNALVEAWYAWMNANHVLSMRTMDQALNLAERTGVHIWDCLLLETGTASALTCGYLDTAQQLLARLAPLLPHARVMDKHYYFHERAWLAILQKDFTRCREYQEQALALANSMGVAFANAEGHYGMAIVMHETAEPEAASRHLAQARACAKQIGSKILDFTCRLAEAQFALDRGDNDAALTELRYALKLGREQGYVTTTWWRPDIISRLLAKAHAHGIEVEYVRHLIRVRGLLPVGDASDLNEWPHPIRIHALGRFVILRDGQPLKFSVKTPKKPLELLKALIALGARSVRVAEIMDLLWQEHGRAARGAFDVALMRLRKILGDVAALTLTDGKLSLNEKICWVDVWSFERAVSRFDKSGDAVDHGAIGLYSGRLLERDGNARWIINERDRLAAKFRRVILKIATAEEHLEKWYAAAQLYRRALEHDNLVEEFHLRLMRCEWRLGQRAEAINTYRRCRDLLSINLQTKPSVEFETLYRQVLAG